MPKLINRSGDAVQSTVSVEQTLTLSADIELEEVIPKLGRLKAIEIVFANFTDGRGYSTAKLLKDRHGFRGELRAIGDITVDQLVYLSRCGFDTFALRDDQDIDVAKKSLSAFSTAYQVTHPLEVRAL
jgi:uncharacterized protein (DUF934 family)